MPNIEKPAQVELRPIALEELRSKLEARVALAKWGQGYAKTIEDLLAELNAGEAKLVEENGELVRETEGLAIDVYCSIGGEVYRLKEDKQVFTDGRVREREGEVMDTSMGEKLHAAAVHDAELERALQEELGIPANAILKHKEGSMTIKERTSGSFPGLKSRHKLYHYDVLLPKDCYKPEGYIEVQPTKSTYFVWEKAETLPNSLKT